MDWSVEVGDRANQEKTKAKSKSEKERTDLVFLGQNEDGVQTQDTRNEQKANIKNENESTVEVEHQHGCTVQLR